MKLIDRYVAEAQQNKMANDCGVRNNAYIQSLRESAKNKNNLPKEK